MRSRPSRNCSSYSHLIRRHLYDRAVPIYEFECEDCGAEFEEILPAESASAICRECGSRRTTRRYSPQAATFKLVKSPGAARVQEARNANLRGETKANFKRRRRAARDAKGKATGDNG